jgi:hypothetical protein
VRIIINEWWYFFHTEKFTYEDEKVKTKEISISENYVHELDEMQFARYDKNWDEKYEHNLIHTIWFTQWKNFLGTKDMPTKGEIISWRRGYQ